MNYKMIINVYKINITQKYQLKSDFAKKIIINDYETNITTKQIKWINWKIYTIIYIGTE
jgi:hypothetical protein